MAVAPNGRTSYVTNGLSASVSVIDTASDAVIATIPVGGDPESVAVSPDSSTVYVANSSSNTVSVISAASNTVITTVAVGTNPFGVAVTTDGSAVYVTNFVDNTVSAISTATNSVTATVPVGTRPASFGVFIQPPPQKVTFAGAPGQKNCHGVSVSALNNQYGNLPAAAKALGYQSVQALQNAIKTYCGN